MRGLMCPYGAHAGAFKRCGNVENRACVSIYGRENLSVTLTLLPAEARVGTGRTGAAATRNVGPPENFMYMKPWCNPHVLLFFKYHNVRDN